MLLFKLISEDIRKGKFMEHIILAHLHNGSDATPVFTGLLIMCIILVAFIATIIKILLICKIFSKAGYCWALGLLMLVPIANMYHGHPGRGITGWKPVIHSCFRRLANSKGTAPVKTTKSTILKIHL